MVIAKLQKAALRGPEGGRFPKRPRAPLGAPPKGIGCLLRRQTGGVVEWGDGEFRERFFWRHDGGGPGGGPGGGHMDGGRHAGWGVRACGRGGGDWVLFLFLRAKSPPNHPTTRERQRESDSERATASPPSHPIITRHPTNQPHTPTVIWGSLGSRLTHQSHKHTRRVARN